MDDRENYRQILARSFPTTWRGKLVNFARLLRERGDTITFEISVDRHSSHYVHERTTLVEVAFDVHPDESFSLERWTHLEKFVDDDFVPRLEVDVVDTNREIYRALNQEYDYQTSDEQVAESLRANDVRFDDTDNTAEDGEGRTFDELDDGEKEAALEKHRDWNVDAGSGWYDHVVGEWTEALERVGFRDVDVRFSGFSSQGDGASFTAKSTDVPKLVAALLKHTTLYAAVKEALQQTGAPMESRPAVDLVNRVLEAAL